MEARNEPRRYGGLLGVIAFAAITLVALAADAGPRRRILIETEPPGATVYVGDKESGPAGVTPLEVILPVGEQTVILELPGYLPRFEVLQVATARPRKQQVVSFTLEPAVATLVIAGADLPAGARVFVDSEDRGAPPLRVDVEPGAHQVEITADGWRPFETWVEVAGGAEQTVEVDMVRVAVAPSTATERRSTPAVAGRPRPPIATVGAGYQVGWRRFRYQQPITSNAQPFDADGAGLIAVSIEVHPLRAIRGARVLWPLSLVASYRHGLPLETDLQGDAVADATWRAADAGLRWRLDLGPWVAVDLDAGWARTLFAFRDQDGEPVDVVPEVDYQALRIGARILAHLGPVDAWAGGENQIVLSGGLVEDRFRGAEVDGYGLRAGAEAHWWRRRITTRVEATWNHYGWTFATMASDEFQADGGSDDLYGLLFALGVTL